MNDLHLFIQRLSARLPELEWQLEKLAVPLTKKTLPANVFRCTNYQNSRACIEEIKNDLSVLTNQKSVMGCHFLVNKISQKIHILTGLCTIKEDKKPHKDLPAFHQSTLESYQNRMNRMQQTIDVLSEQQQALSSRLQALPGDNPMIIPLQAELGELARRLTIAQEALAKELQHV